MSIDLATIEELAISSARERAQRPVSYEVIRELTPEDLAAAGRRMAKTTPTFVKLRHSHHLLAWMISQGKPLEEISLITGYDTARISLLKGSPAFEELIAYYTGQASALDLDIRARITALGVDFMDELQGRLEEKPEAFSNQQVLDAATALLDRGLASKGGQQRAGASLIIEFVTPVAPTGAKLIEQEPQK